MGKLWEISWIKPQNFVIKTILNAGTYWFRVVPINTSPFFKYMLEGTFEYSKHLLYLTSSMVLRVDCLFNLENNIIPLVWGLFSSEMGRNNGQLLWQHITNNSATSEVLSWSITSLMFYHIEYIFYIRSISNQKNLHVWATWAGFVWLVDNFYCNI